MGRLLRKLTIWICIPIYKLIKSFYSIFYNIANTRFLEDDTIQQLSANIYVLVSVVMLFAFSVTILSAIVNPDLLNDSKKGVAAAFKRAIIGLALMVIVPFVFDEIYVVQKNIMDNSLIEKIIVGADFSCNQNEDGECEAGANGGQVIAGNLISAVLYPVADNVQISENISDKYEKMITTDIRYIGSVAKHINVTTEGDNAYHSDFDDEDYAFNWDGLVAIIAGGATCYILLLFAIDMAVRVFKLAFLELTAPISIVAYMASGDKVLKSWGQEVLKTFLDVFVRIAAMAFYLFLIKNLSTYMEKFEGKDWSFVVKVLLIVGMLIFIKQIPDLINSVFGTNIKLKGGIGGRLGEMAVVGKQAQTAWNSVRNPLAAAAGVGSMALGTGAHVVSAIRTSSKNGAAAVKRIRADGRRFSGIRAAGATIGAIAGGAWGASFGSVSAAARSLKNGVNNKNLHSMKDEYDLYKDTHKTGSTVAGRALDDIRMGVGFKSRADSRSGKNESLVKVQEALNSATTAAENFLARDDSTRTVLTTTDEQGNTVAMNLHQATEFISTMRKNAPVRRDNEDYADYQRRISTHMQEINQLENQLQQARQTEIENIIADANNGSLTGAGGIEVSYEINNHLNDARKAVKDSKISGVNISVSDLGTSNSVHNNIYEDSTGALDVVAEEITVQNEIKDSKGNLTRYGRQKADADSINNRPGNKSGGSSGKDSGSSK